MSSILSPGEILAESELLGKAKHNYSFKKTVLMGFLAGVYISMGGLLSIIVGYGMPGIAESNPGLQKFMVGATFPLGLLLVVIAGADLFTGNNAMLATAALKKHCSWLDAFVNWTTIFFSNFAGALFFVFFFVYLTGTVDAEPWNGSIMKIATTKVSQPWHVIFLKGIAANWLVCLAIWLGLSAKDTTGKIIGLWWPVMCFVAIGYEHCIANMFYVPLGMLQGADVSISQFVFNNLIPSTIGNIIGGALFVGALYWYIFNKASKK